MCQQPTTAALKHETTRKTFLLYQPTADDVDLRGNLGQSGARDANAVNPAASSFFLVVEVLPGLEGAGDGVWRWLWIAMASRENQIVREGTEGGTEIQGVSCGGEGRPNQRRLGTNRGDLFHY